ncbi:MAG: C4-type zinc ribbon domain-containing protein, partial [Paludibacteraceae bacterium]|nr:C4-type zinc ribbon domain-containing protein [Paludibacteraceae bacterium]
MAENTETVKEISVEEKLKALHQLQNKVSEIDKIKILRGELPIEVQDLKDEIEGLDTRIANIQNDLATIATQTSDCNNKIKDAGALVAKYKEQIDNVSNSREFDHLSKEIEYQELEIELAKKHINDYGVAKERKEDDLQKAENAKQEKIAILKEKEEQLEEIIVDTKQDEERLRKEAKEIESIIDPRLLQAFKRIRKNARNGLAVVTIERDACGGCFNKIPAQRQLDIRSRKKIIVCEHCGRILVDP